MPKKRPKRRPKNGHQPATSFPILKELRHPDKFTVRRLPWWQVEEARGEAERQGGERRRKEEGFLSFLQGRGEAGWDLAVLRVCVAG